MKPIDFKGRNVVLGEKQPEYIALPAHKSPDGAVLTCWKLSWRERLKLLFTGRVWSHQLTFNMPLQPQLVQVDNPFKEQDND